MESTFQYRSSDISYRDIGSGKPVVLLHGFGEDSHIWDRQIEFLKGDCRLIVPDLPGSGKSLIANENWSLANTVEAMADCVLSLISSITDEPVIMLGHSMGGYVTLAFAEKNPRRSRAFGLVHSTAFADAPEKKETRRKAIGFIKAKGGYAFLKTSIPGLFGEAFTGKHPEKVEELVEESKDFTDGALIAYYEAMISRPDRVSVLKSSIVPVLFILGTEDKAVLLDDVLQQVHLPEVSYVHILQKVAHMGMWEATEAVNKHLLDFVQDIK